MMTITCPFCSEKGRIPENFSGKRIKCGKCNNRFVVTPPTPKGAASRTDKAETFSAAPSDPAIAAIEGIEVEGLHAASWSAGAGTESAVATKVEPETEPGEAPQGVFTESHADQPVDVKEYKILSQKDKWFEGKFDLQRLEEAINHYAQRGWKVRAMTTAQVLGFSGGLKEELVVLMER
jgi:Domain of unknown function (DUF4177)